MEPSSQILEWKFPPAAKMYMEREGLAVSFQEYYVVVTWSKYREDIPLYDKRYEVCVNFFSYYDNDDVTYI